MNNKRIRKTRVFFIVILFLNIIQMKLFDIVHGPYKIILCPLKETRKCKTIRMFWERLSSTEVSSK